MSIRLRLLVSYLAMLIIPLILFILATLLLLTAFRGDLKELRNLSLSGNNALWFDNDHDYRLFHELKQEVDTNPAALQATLQSMDQELKQTHTGVVLRENGQVVHTSDSIIKPEVLLQLTEMKQADHFGDEKTQRVGNISYSINQYDFTLSDKSKGSLFLVREVNPLVRFAQKFFPLLLIALLVILVLTNTVLTYFVSRSIIRPLKKLKEAAKQIKEGNLNFKLTNTSRDEIGQLSIAFEEMRFQLKESIEKQLRYEDNRKELLSNISHDLKTPITSIKGYAAGIQDGIANTPEMMAKYMKIISSQAEGMDYLIDELFLFSKLDLKRFPFDFEQVDIGAYLSDFMEEFHYGLEDKIISVEVDFQDIQGKLVLLDRKQFKRVMTNILNNSLKYMDKAYKVLSLKGIDFENHVKIEIADNGQGIEAEALAYIFDRFYRAEQSRNSAMGGSGLGLAIAKKIVLEHGGEIEVESVFGKNTILTIQLPKKSSKAGELL